MTDAARLQPHFERVARHPASLTTRLEVADAVDAELPSFAEFIRNGVRLTTLERRSPDASKARRAERILLRKGVRRLVFDPFRSWLTGWIVYGGWVEGGTVVATDFLREAESRFTQLPLRHLALEASDGLLDAILEAPWLPRLRSLRLPGAVLRDRDAKRIADSPAVAGLRYLALHDSEIGIEGLEAFAASEHLSALQHLELRWDAPQHVREPWMDQGAVIGFGRCETADRLERAFGPRAWLNRADEVPPSCTSV